MCVGGRGREGGGGGDRQTDRHIKRQRQTGGGDKRETDRQTDRQSQRD